MRPAERGRRSESQAQAIDETDKAIITELQVDGRLPYAQLGPRVGLSQAATRQRVQRLIERGVMQVVAVTDPLMLGFEVEAMIGVSVDGDLRSVASSLAEQPEIEYVVIAAGRFDLLVEVVCEDNKRLLAIVNDVVRATPGVTGTEVFTYLHLEKQTYTWGTR
ncbi:MAG: Leucine-responsive regulatory protein [Acidimicrobiales bacterium]|nr:MAG: Lrp/AsnC family transcriptional regulator [Actinomycetota bacterium]MBV6509370.1 Leucine-responsive regulatory protein [Acidimicrobiales bacterium]RIK04595.1 MAG: AsnC family transcriptional regulator [Acidobacteriota bacterium]